MRHDGIHKWQFLFTPFSGNIGCQSSSFFKNKRYFFKQRNCAFYGSIFKNHFVTNFAFKADLDTIIDSNLVQDDIFSDIKRYMLNKTAE